MKKMFLVSALLLIVGASIGQDNAKALRNYPGKVKYQKTEQDATVYEIPYPKDEVEAGMKKMMDDRGIKVNEKNGFYEAKNVTLVKRGSHVCDAYYKVEKDGKTASKVYLILTEPGEDVSNRQSSQAMVAAAAGGTAVAATMGSSLGDNNQDVQIRNQEEDIRNSEKKLSKLADEQKSLQKKITDLQNSLDKNTQDQTRMQQEIDAKKASLETFRSGKTKNSN